MNSVGGYSFPVVGQGKVDLDISTEAQGVLYIPGIRKNLWFVGKFVDEGHITLFGSRSCWILNKTKPHQIIYSRT